MAAPNPEASFNLIRYVQQQHTAIDVKELVSVLPPAFRSRAEVVLVTMTPCGPITRRHLAGLMNNKERNHSFADLFKMMKDATPPCVVVYAVIDGKRTFTPRGWNGTALVLSPEDLTRACVISSSPRMEPARVDDSDKVQRLTNRAGRTVPAIDVGNVLAPHAGNAPAAGPPPGVAPAAVAPHVGNPPVAAVPHPVPVVAPPAQATLARARGERRRSRRVRNAVHVVTPPDVCNQRRRLN